MKKEIFLYKLLKDNAYFFSVYSCGLTYSFVASDNNYGEVDGVDYILVKSDKWKEELKVLLKSRWKKHCTVQVLFPDPYSIYKVDHPFNDIYIPLKIRLWIIFGFLFINWRHLRKESEIDKDIKEEKKAIKKECLKNKLESKKFFGEI